MNDLSAFFVACFASPALLTSACASLFVPTAAWLAVRRIRRSLERMNDDAAWQAALSAAAAMLPGSLFIVLAATALRGGWGSACLQFATGRALYGTVAALTVLGLVRAVWLAVQRARDVRRLVAQSVPASPRAQKAADAANVRIRELRSVNPLLFVAGVFRPTVFASSGALDRVTDAELLAAVRHEAAHARRGDVLCAAVVTFVSDFVPFPVRDLIALFRRAREFAADAHAVRDADPCDLASAMLSLARPAVHVHAAAFADAGTVSDRLRTLLAPLPNRPSLARRWFVVAALAGTFLAGAVPLAGVAIFGFTCSMGMAM